MRNVHFAGVTSTFELQAYCSNSMRKNIVHHKTEINTQNKENLNDMELLEVYSKCPNLERQTATCAVYQEFSIYYRF